jgi:hypothetical protein
MQAILVVVPKTLFENGRVQYMERFQRLHQIQVPNERRELYLNKRRNRNEVAPRHDISVVAQTGPLDLLVEKRREQEKPIVLELKSFPPFSNSAFSEDQTCLAALN